MYLGVYLRVEFEIHMSVSSLQPHMGLQGRT